MGNGDHGDLWVLIGIPKHQGGDLGNGINE